jgi:hypothetical protein
MESIATSEIERNVALTFLEIEPEKKLWPKWDNDQPSYKTNLKLGGPRTYGIRSRRKKQLLSKFLNTLKQSLVMRDISLRVFLASW